MNPLNVKVKTKRLSLEPISFEFADVIFKNFTKDITTYMYPQPSGNKKDTLNFIESSLQTMKEGTNLQFVMKHRHTDEFLGNIGLHHIDRLHPEFGIWLKKDAHGCGYGFEAIEALFEFAKKNLNFEYILYPVDRNNIPSRRIPERLNGKVEKEYKMKNAVGTELDIIEYRIYK